MSLKTVSFFIIGILLKIRSNYGLDINLPIDPIKFQTCEEGDIIELHPLLCNCVPPDRLLCKNVGDEVLEEIIKLDDESDIEDDFTDTDCRDKNDCIRLLSNYPILNSEDEVSCNPGAIYRKSAVECNTLCYCDESSKLLCGNENKKNKMCYNDVPLFYPPPDKIDTFPALDLNDGNCTPGVFFKSSCNICFCSQTSNKICKYNYCPDLNYASELKANLKTGTNCDDSENDDPCVVCTCTNNNIQSCKALPDCNSGRNKLKLVGKEANVPPIIDPMTEECVIGVAYHHDCNRCVCVHTGELVCTQKICLSQRMSRDIARLMNGIENDL